MGRAISEQLKPPFTYTTAFNGIAVELSAKQARIVAAVPGVVDVRPDFTRFLQTDAGPGWIGADTVWNSLSTKGEGIVIGVIDTGINPANPSFVDPGADGYDHANLRGVFYGICNSSDPKYDSGFCNDKLIGAYDFTSALTGNPATSLDVNGHGSHTASTVDGNFVTPATVIAPPTTIDRDISGVAPHANIISYRACYSDSVGGCPGSVLVASIDQAVQDGVDVINYSIGGGSSDPWLDYDAQAFLAARQAGVVVVTSAGNNGPSSETAGSPGDAPWLIAVGASTHGRAFENSLIGLTNTSSLPLGDIQGQGITDGYGPKPIVYAGDPPYSDRLCGKVAPGTWTNGEIVVCDRGTYGRVEKGENVLARGAGGYVLANDSANASSFERREPCVARDAYQLCRRRGIESLDRRQYRSDVPPERRNRRNRRRRCDGVLQLSRAERVRAGYRQTGCDGAGYEYIGCGGNRYRSTAVSQSRGEL